MTNTKVNSRTEALGLVKYGYDYIDAARLVDSKIGEQHGYEFISPIPAYFLAWHGIELTLKAFLSYRGVDSKTLRSKSYGHDLGKCYRKAKEFGLFDVFKINSDDVKAMAMLVRLNNNQGLRYHKAGWKRFPSWAIVEPLAVRLHQAIAHIVGCKTFSDTFY